MVPIWVFFLWQLKKKQEKNYPCRHFTQAYSTSFIEGPGLKKSGAKGSDAGMSDL